MRSKQKQDDPNKAMRDLLHRMEHDSPAQAWWRYASPRERIYSVGLGMMGVGFLLFGVALALNGSVLLVLAAGIFVIGINAAILAGPQAFVVKMIEVAIFDCLPLFYPLLKKTTWFQGMFG